MGLCHSCTADPVSDDHRGGTFNLETGDESSTEESEAVSIGAASRNSLSTREQLAQMKPVCHKNDVLHVVYEATCRCN